MAPRDILRTDHLILCDVKDPHVVIAQLHEILIGRDDGNLKSFLLGGIRVGSNNIISLEPRDRNDWNSKCLLLNYATNPRKHDTHICSLPT